MNDYLRLLGRMALLGTVLIVVLWYALRLWRKLRRPMSRLGDDQADEDALRTQAWAVLAGRLARGDIDRVTYDRLTARLWGLPAPTSAPGPEPAGGTPAPPPAPGSEPVSPTPGATTGNPPPARDLP